MGPRRALLIALTSVLAAAGAAAPAHAAAGCAWFGETDQRDVNVGAPDLDAFYWLDPITVRPGETTVVHGRFPHARYFSFHVYDESGNALDSIYDTAIDPAAGSANRFRAPVAPRAGDGYAVSVRFAARPKTPAANTVYVDPSAVRGVALLVYRIYVPDHPSDVTGDVGLPSVDAQAGCSVTPPPFGSALWDRAAGTAYPDAAPRPADDRATRVPVWERAFGSRLGNQQNAYLVAQLSRRYGDLLVVHAPAPTFPDTRSGVAPSAPAQLRYWSFCTYDADGEAGFGCGADYTAALRDGAYTYVVSDPGDRPADATAAQGVTWLPWGGTQSSAQIVFRTMLPAAGFRHAAERIGEHDSAQAVMGPYYPTAVYCARATFEAGGWRACFAAAGVHAPAPPSVSRAPRRSAPPRNPFTAANGAATMHADSESSDASPYPGPGAGPLKVGVTELGAACPTVLQGSDGVPIALCTAIADRRPTVYELDPGTGAAVASLSLPAGNLFGGVYAYLDQRDRLVLFDASGDLLRIGHRAPAAGPPALAVDERVPAGQAISARCPNVCGGVVGLAPDWRGRVWFATANGVAGFVDPRGGAVRTLSLGAGEHVANSISTAPGGTAIATDHALYLLHASRTGRPRVLWRAPYDRGPARKPGQLSHGTGATPTFFGPDGTRYLAITDNASPVEHLLVYDTRARRARRRLVCATPVLTPGPSGTENSPVGHGRSVYVASTYGYPLPAAPEGAEPTQPASAPFTGGVTRVDLRRGGRGCDVRWQARVHSASVPRLDVPDGLLYTVDRTNPLNPDDPTDGDEYASVALDAATGAVVHRQPLGATEGMDTLQLAPTIVPGRILYQGTISGIVRLSPLSPSGS